VSKCTNTIQCLAEAEKSNGIFENKHRRIIEKGKEII